jgi:hypothetical protein
LVEPIAKLKAAVYANDGFDSDSKVFYYGESFAFEKKLKSD